MLLKLGLNIQRLLVVPYQLCAAAKSLFIHTIKGFGPTNYHTHTHTVSHVHKLDCRVLCCCIQQMINDSRLGLPCIHHHHHHHLRRAQVHLHSLIMAPALKFTLGLIRGKEEEEEEVEATRRTKNSVNII